MAFLQALPLRIFRTHTSARYAALREKARLARGALMSGGRHAISFPCAIISTTKSAENLIGELNQGQNLRTCLKIMFVRSVQRIQKLFYDMEMLSNRGFLPFMIRRTIPFCFRVISIHWIEPAS